ncbi:hypothetical protein JR316_0009926 [Psilocybe cubensis]|uniref:Uncharacterized protein n=1 Tax=Psilocybe cubensis TaxID=181762 RepID=A0ACB8GPN6_PSICU|nr:hypothetical protein JR316_0009926 [Psilocybe cubensis]KAH9477700.1 hypothetical protein JR316_0009926 [Psilocybe cubensis]
MKRKFVVSLARLFTVVTFVTTCAGGSFYNAHDERQETCVRGQRWRWSRRKETEKRCEYHPLLLKEHQQWFQRRQTTRCSISDGPHRSKAR